MNTHSNLYILDTYDGKKFVTFSMKGELTQIEVCIVSKKMAGFRSFISNTR